MYLYVALELYVVTTLINYIYSIIIYLCLGYINYNESTVTRHNAELYPKNGTTVDATLTNSEDAGTGDSPDATEPETVVSITLPATLFNEASDEEVGLAFTFYESSNLFPLANGTRNDVVVGTSVIGALVAGKDVLDLEDPVIITLSLLQDVTTNNLYKTITLHNNFYHSHIRYNFSNKSCRTSSILYASAGTSLLQVNYN